MDDRAQAEADIGSATPVAGPSAAAASPAELGRAAGKAGPAKARELLDAQIQLARTQERMLELQVGDRERSREIERRHSALRFFRERLHVLLELIGVAVGLIVLVGLAAMVWEAHQSRGLVIEAFSVPPDLARDGLTGQVVAARVLDRLRDMQSLTESERPAASYTRDWGDDIKVEIPDTGLTLEQLERFLRARLGHASRISGEVFNTGTGIALSARIDAAPAQTFVGPPGEIDDLARQAAEAIYRTNQPYRYRALGRGAAAARRRPRRRRQIRRGRPHRPELGLQPHDVGPRAGPARREGFRPRPVRRGRRGRAPTG